MLILVPSVCLSSLWSMNFIGIAYKSLREGLYTGLSEPYHWLCLWRRHFFPSQKPFLPPFYMIEFRAAKICAVLIHVLWVQQCNGNAVPRKQFSTSFLGLQVLSSPSVLFPERWLWGPQTMSSLRLNVQQPSILPALISCELLQLLLLSWKEVSLTKADSRAHLWAQTTNMDKATLWDT